MPLVQHAPANRVWCGVHDLNLEAVQAARVRRQVLARERAAQVLRTNHIPPVVLPLGSPCRSVVVPAPASDYPTLLGSPDKRHYSPLPVGPKSRPTDHAVVRAQARSLHTSTLAAGDVYGLQEKDAPSGLQTVQARYGSPHLSSSPSPATVIAPPPPVCGSAPRSPYGSRPGQSLRSLRSVVDQLTERGKPVYFEYNQVELEPGQHPLVPTGGLSSSVARQHFDNRNIPPVARHHFDNRNTLRRDCVNSLSDYNNYQHYLSANLNEAFAQQAAAIGPPASHFALPSAVVVRRHIHKERGSSDFPTNPAYGRGVMPEGRVMPEEERLLAIQMVRQNYEEALVGKARKGCSMEECATALQILTAHRVYVVEDDVQWM